LGGLSYESICIFLLCINLNIYVDGFVAETEAMAIFNKKVFKIEDIEKSSVILCPVEMQDTVKLGNYSVEYIQVHKIKKEIVTNGIYIYGAGECGKRTLEFFTTNGVKIKGFLDSDNNKIGKEILNYNIFDYKKIDKDEIVVISALKNKEIYNEIKDRFENIYVDYAQIYQVDYPYAIIRPEGLRQDIIWNLPGDLLILDRDILGKEVFIYGDKDYVKKIEHFFALIDIRATWITEQEEPDISCKKVSIDEFLYYDNQNIIVLSALFENKGNLLINSGIEKLCNLGLEFNTQIKDAMHITDNNIREYRINKKYGCNMSPLLGYTIKYPNTSDIYKEYIIYEAHSENKIKLMVLGGSTADSGLYYGFIKSWPEILVELFQQVGINVDLFNGAVGGYNVRQEFLKLIRDIEIINPDIVISYSGINDAYPMQKEGFPFLFNFHIPVYNRIQNEYGVELGPQNTSESASACWIRCEEMMKVICENRGTQFYAFFQPAIYNKKILSLKETKIKEFEKNKYNHQHNYLSKKERYNFIKYAVQRKNKSFIYDLSDIVDNEEKTVFIDSCHMTEYGNKIIASKIFDEIKKSGRLFFSQVNK